MPVPDSSLSGPSPLTAEAWALLDGGSAGRFCACGKFATTREPPANGVAFYVNDFALSDRQPWRILSIEADPGPAAESTAPVIVWKPPSREEFQPVFDELMAAVRCREILKAVPVTAATGRIQRGGMGAWMRTLLSGPLADVQGFSFAWMEAEHGFGGMTPEILFEIEGRRLTTMALAGTTDAAHAADLTERPKLAREHAIVVDELQRRLAVLGNVETGERGILTQGTMRHLRTRLDVTLDRRPDGEALNNIVRLLHPTPALGISPRTGSSTAMLQRCRESQDTPAAFGAPFGVAWPGGALFVVAIRGVFWQGDRVLLPAGGGLVAGSEFNAEWEEMELKRAWVRRALELENP